MFTLAICTSLELGFKNLQAHLTANLEINVAFLITLVFHLAYWEQSVGSTKYENTLYLHWAELIVSPG